MSHIVCYDFTAETPVAMEYAVEDGEIDTDDSEHEAQLSEPEGQDAEYDPLMVGDMQVLLFIFIIATCVVHAYHCKKNYTFVYVAFLSLVGNVGNLQHYSF